MRLSRSGIGLSLLVHALAVCALMQAVWQTPQRSADRVLQGEIVWLGAKPAPAAPEERPAPTQPGHGLADDSRIGSAPVRSRRSQPAKRTAAEAAIVAPSAPSPNEPLTPAPSGPSAPDLAEARRRVTVGVLEEGARADARRSFAFPGTIAEQRAFDESERIRRRERGLGPPLTVFDSPAKGRAGLAEEPAVYGVHWVSDDCYVFREPTERFAVLGMLIPPVPPTTCTRRLGRTDLFVTAKPSYLMGTEERAAVDAEIQRREVLRRPTTGAVMPLAKD
jgi:hypothetical protein